MSENYSDLFNYSIHSDNYLGAEGHMMHAAFIYCYYNRDCLKVEMLCKL